MARKEGGWLTNMQMQKLVYIAHGYHLGVLGAPLFRDRVYAWQFGPVIPRLYDALKIWGADFVKKRLETLTPPIKPDTAEWKVIEVVWAGYGNFSGPELSAMTHKPGSPWALAWEPGKKNPIPDDTIEAYYRQLINASGIPEQPVAG
ncbi:MAG: type II toxin-antitoxin system antitoxin SocA domain-containing protein [Pyrinomonadaceae bacterium]